MHLLLVLSSMHECEMYFSREDLFEADQDVSKFTMDYPSFMNELQTIVLRRCSTSSNKEVAVSIAR